MFENLEPRRLFAATLTVSPAGVLTVNGNGANDIISVREDQGAVHVEYVDAANNFVSTDLTAINAININGGGGADSLSYTGNSIGAVIHGDNQTGGSQGGAKNDGVSGKGDGGAGSDTISVSDDGTGSYSISGDNGDDSLTVLHGNNTLLLGGSGNDFIYVNSAGSGGSVMVDGESGSDTITIYSGVNTVNGGNGKDTVLIDVPPGPGDQNFGGSADPSLQTLLHVEKVFTF